MSQGIECVAQNNSSSSSMAQRCQKVGDPCKGITLKPKQKYVKSIIITKIINYNLEVSDWRLFLDHEAANA